MPYPRGQLLWAAVGFATCSMQEVTRVRSDAGYLRPYRVDAEWNRARALACGAAGGVGGIEEGGVTHDGRLRLWCVPLVIPDCVAVAMEANDLRVLHQRIDFHHECGGHEDLFAGVALLPVAWTSEGLRCAVAGKTTVSELRADEKADSVRVHNGLTCWDKLNNAAPTKVSTQRKAGVRAG